MQHIYKFFKRSSTRVLSTRAFASLYALCISIPILNTYSVMFACLRAEPAPLGRDDKT